MQQIQPLTPQRARNKEMDSATVCTQPDQAAKAKSHTNTWAKPVQNLIPRPTPGRSLSYGIPKDPPTLKAPLLEHSEDISLRSGSPQTPHCQRTLTLTLGHAGIGHRTPRATACAARKHPRDVSVDAVFRKERAVLRALRPAVNLPSPHDGQGV